MLYLAYWTPPVISIQVATFSPSFGHSSWKIENIGSYLEPNAVILINGLHHFLIFCIGALFVCCALVNNKK